VSDLKLFRIVDGKATELAGASFDLERRLQQLVEDNMDALFGVRFVKSEHSTGATHRGRIDSLGLDENCSPVIFEYKRGKSENVMNQGLFYLDWLLDHKAEFQLLVMERFGQEAARKIDWRNPRLICVANDFTNYDEHAVQQMARSIELVRYRDFQGELLAFELVRKTSNEAADAAMPPEIPGAGASTSTASKSVSEYLERADQQLRDLYLELESFCESLGEDVTKKVTKWYFAFRRLKNFASVEVHPQKRELLVFLRVDPDTVDIDDGFVRDVRSIGHYGTGDLEVRIKQAADLLKAQPLIQQSYEAS
jgi:predicted transport protein